MIIVSYIFSFLFGTAIGSFLNVLIYRIPLGKSIITPGSFCPRCKKPIKWYENIPIVSFILLRGRCSGCRQPISIRYPLVELITGCAFLYLFIKYNLTVAFFFYIFFFCALIVISGIDFSHQVIPDVISIPGIAAGLLFQIIKGNFLPGLVGLIFGGGLILLIRVIGGRVYKKEVMGMGDVYLTAMIGAFVGFPFILVSIFIGAFTGAVLGVIYVISTHQSRESPIPFGPFLSLGGMTVIIFETQVFQLFASMGVYL
ncbi:MAG TPA: prepilin peptidase [candidate division WOR-3 bacterium]|uniref:Prepilin leader peptidase/N-methyltransferase n=1 Tax=candidate division WOR-3 bacterium TaxID=2052148 RepID=A0A9C9EMR7_UNCW3|nr:prepilin peptidase [candidate division WOR-3 bacterium]